MSVDRAKIDAAFHSVIGAASDEGDVGIEVAAFDDAIERPKVAVEFSFAAMVFIVEVGMGVADACSDVGTGGEGVVDSSEDAGGVGFKGAQMVEALVVVDEIAEAGDPDVGCAAAVAAVSWRTAEFVLVLGEEVDDVAVIAAVDQFECAKLRGGEVDEGAVDVGVS